ncbi:reticulon-1-like isoform X1 [Pristis pectinata]|uniref:reticulon-1-like isoform X1 n=1 Tax=Pristis pectinata TaxID=685728 RepID=UPI00223E59ED|nr:reticulon-1-like isoform X1 [Pristis pectinata]
MGQVLGFGHCKESASTVSTTPDSTPSSTEGVSEDYLEPQTAQDLSDDDAPTDTSLYWDTPRQLSLDSALLCGAPLVQAGCFPATFPSSSLSDLAGRGFGDGGSGCGVPATDVLHRTKKQPSAPRGLVRTETIETFLAEEKDEVEEYHIHPPGMTEQEEREGVSELREGADWDPSPSSPVPFAPGALLLSQDSEETEVPTLGLGETTTETQIDPVGTSSEQKDPEGPEVEGELSVESTVSNKVEMELTEVLGVMLLATEPQLPRVTEEELPSSDPHVSGSEEEEMAVLDHGGGMGTPDAVQAVSLAGTLMPTGEAGIVDGAPLGGSDISALSSDAIGRQLPAIQVTTGHESQEEMDDEAQAESRQLPWQHSALEQSDHRKTEVFKAADQSDPKPGHNGQSGHLHHYTEVLRIQGRVPALKGLRHWKKGVAGQRSVCDVIGGGGYCSIHKAGWSRPAPASGGGLLPQPCPASSHCSTRDCPNMEARSECPGMESVWNSILRREKVIDLLYWEDVKKTGTLFGAVILTLFSLTQFSSISVLAYLVLSALSVTISLRLYTSVLHLIYKTQEVHPFQSYLDLDISLSQEQLRKYSETLMSYLTSTINHLRRLILVEDLLDSLKFGVLLWLLTYIGALFNGLTLTILVVVGAFIIPLIYRKHKVQINQYLGLLRGQIKDVTAKIQAKLPGSRPKAE